MAEGRARAYDGIAGAAVDRLGRDLVDCFNTGYMMRDSGLVLLTYGVTWLGASSLIRRTSLRPWRRLL